MLNNSDLENRYEELGKLIGDPEVMADLPLWQQYVKSHADLTDVVTVYREYSKVIKDIDEAKSILADETDSEMREMAQMELDELVPKREQLEQHLKVLLLPRDPNDEKNVIMEIRAGTGGEEAGLFALICSACIPFCRRQGWRQPSLIIPPTSAAYV